MVEVLKSRIAKEIRRPHTLAIEDQLLLTLNYLRELQHSIGIGCKLPYR